MRTKWVLKVELSCHKDDVKQVNALLDRCGLGPNNIPASGKKTAFPATTDVILTLKQIADTVKSAKINIGNRFGKEKQSSVLAVAQKRAVAHLGKDEYKPGNGVKGEVTLSVVSSVKLPDSSVERVR